MVDGRRGEGEELQINSHLNSYSRDPSYRSPEDMESGWGRVGIGNHVPALNAREILCNFSVNDFNYNLSKS